MIERRLGEGSMGAVYLALDRELRAHVALKTLRRVDPVGIYRFKREFRALADLHHPNLVRLHELFCEGDQWFFTMEYVEGKSFLDYVLTRSARDSPSASHRVSESWPLFESGIVHESGEMRLEGLEMLFPTPMRDPERLRKVLVQITEGLCAAHALGKLHRDLKPDNVLVTSDGRAVLLDFGIVFDAEHEPQDPVEPAVLGTPAYMSPEQAGGHAIDETSDFYALGCMLYEALTGSIPFDGPYQEVLQQKQERDPVPPSRLVSGIPEDLETLCNSLLLRDPKLRPRGDAILRALHSRKIVSLPPASSTALTQDGALPFIGRGAELLQLRAALAASDGGKPVVALLSGPSGIGKTTLVEHFVDELAERGQAIVLQGRCYERESLPFKAIDSLVDSLSRYLRRLPAVQVAEVMPRDILALAQLFPVLHRVEDVSQTKRRAPLPSDPQELRRRAFAALKELFSRIADRSPLVLFIDDLQWGDVDSARLIVELVTGLDSPAVLLLCAFRGVEVDENPCLRTLLGYLHEGTHVDVHRITLGALSREDSVRLARTLLGSETPADAQAVGEEAGGSPYLLAELVRYVHGRSAADTGVVSFEHALELRLSTLSKDARMLLQLLAVAARPVPEDMLALASAFNIDLPAALAELRAQKLVRGVATRDARAVECYHDRIREAVTTRMPPELLALWHRRLASTLEASGSPDLEALTAHLLGAGERVRAGLYALRAAAQAERALAFDKAARLYAIAVVHHGHSDADKRELLMRWGDALVNAGRGAEAANVYLEMSRLSEGPHVEELRRKAGIQLVIGGYVEEGIEVLQDSLREVGAPLPESFEAALRELHVVHEELRARGLGFLGRSEDQLAPNVITNLDALWAVTLGLLTSEIDRPLPLVARYLAAALAAGERERIVQALSLYHAYVDGPLSGAAVGGGRHGFIALGALAQAEELLRAHETASGKAWLGFAHGCELQRIGEWQKALASFEPAEELFRAQGPAGVSAVRLCRLLITWSHFSFGIVDKLEVAERWARDAEERSDLLLATPLRILTSFLGLVRDDPQSARDQCVAAMAAARQSATGFLPLCDWVANVRIDLYALDDTNMLARVPQADDLLRSALGSSPLWRASILLARATLLLGAAEGMQDASPLLARADADAAAIALLELPCFADSLRLLQACIAHRRGDTQGAISSLDAVLASPAAQAQPLLLASALRRRAELGQARVAGLVQHADAMMRERGVVDPSRMVRVFAPGFARPPQP